MGTKLERLLGRSKNQTDSVQSAISNKNNLISFEFDGNEYFVAIKESVLVFDSDMNLLYNFETSQLALSDNDFLKKVNEIVTQNSNECVHLYINKVSSVEHITFTSLFDATFIFRKMKRLMNRDSEGIMSLIIEKDSQIIRSAHNERLEFKESLATQEFSADVENREARNESKTEYIATLSRVEDIIETLIGDNIRELGLQDDNEKVKKAIRLLGTLVDDEEHNEE